MHLEESNGWPEYKRMVIKLLEEYSKRLDNLEKVSAIRDRDIAVLKVKISFVSAVISVSISTLITLFLK